VVKVLAAVVLAVVVMAVVVMVAAVVSSPSDSNHLSLSTLEVRA
jgi:hypothetical protein